VPVKLQNRITFFSVTALVVFLFAREPLAHAGDCVQNRATAPAPAKIYQQANPLKPTRDTLRAGRKLYMGDAKPFGCYPCHGINGNSKGMTALKMNLKPRDFSCKAMMKDIPDGQLFWIIKHGSAGTEMKAYKNLKDEQVWQIVTYIRQFSK
jgi:mono/diheme cytochrome c family protein